MKAIPDTVLYHAVGTAHPAAAGPVTLKDDWRVAEVKVGSEHATRAVPARHAGPDAATRHAVTVAVTAAALQSTADVSNGATVVPRVQIVTHCNAGYGGVDGQRKLPHGLGHIQEICGKVGVIDVIGDRYRQFLFTTCYIPETGSKRL